MKYCWRCKTILTLENTSASSLMRKVGVACRKCSRETQMEYRLQNPKAYILARVRGNAKSTGRECSLQLEDIPNIPEFCPVLPWIRLEYEVGGMGLGMTGRKDSAPSLDRIDRSIGYVKGNVRVVSWRANSLKKDATDQELFALGEDARKRLSI